MKITKMIRTPVSCTIIVSMLFFGIQAPSMADIVSTQDLAMQVELQLQNHPTLIKITNAH